MSKKKKDQKAKRKKIMKSLLDSKSFLKKVSVLMKMEDYPKKEIKRAFKEAMKRQAEDSEIVISAWSKGGKKSRRNSGDLIDDEDFFSLQTDSCLDALDKSIVHRRDKNIETINLISSILR